jgi:hypothetical protein
VGLRAETHLALVLCTVCIDMSNRAAYDKAIFRSVRLNEETLGVTASRFFGLNFAVPCGLPIMRSQRQINRVIGTAWVILGLFSFHFYIRRKKSHGKAFRTHSNMRCMDFRRMEQIIDRYRVFHTTQRRRPPLLLLMSFLYIRAVVLANTWHGQYTYD